MEPNLEELFLRWRERGDLRALAKVFEATSGELLAIAAHLCRHREEAEEAVQSTYLTVLENAQRFDRERALRPWMAGVLAVHARRMRWRAAAEEAPELAAHDGPEQHASAHELARAVDSALRGMPENFSQIVRRHLAHGMPPRELAREFGLSESNARSRLHRGLKLLRRALPAGFGPGAVAATSRARTDAIKREVLVRGAEIAGVSVPAAAPSLALMLVAVVAAIAVGIAAFASWRGARRGSLAELASIDAPTDEDGALDEEPSTAEVSAPTAQRTERERVDDSALTARAAPAVVRGRLVLEDGSAASGADVRCAGWSSPEAVTATPQRAAPWSDPQQVLADDEGRFEFAFEPPRAHQFRVDAELDGFSPVRWSLGRLDAGEARDLGEAVMPRACVIAVRLWGASGEVLHDDWSVDVETERGGFGFDEPEPYRGSARFDAAMESFVLRTAPSGELKIRARHVVGVTVEGAATCRLDEWNEASLVYAGPDPQRRVAVRLMGSMINRRHPPSADRLRLEAAGAAPRTASTDNPRATGRYWFDDVPPGDYALVLDDERFEPFVATGVTPGRRVDLPARGAAAIRLRVVDPSGAELARPHSLSINWPLEGSSSNDVVLKGVDEPEPVDHVYSGLVPGVEMRLMLDFEDGARSTVDVAPVSSGEVREVLVVIDSSRAIAGRVLDESGRPDAGVVVELTRGPIAGDHRPYGGSRSVNGVAIPACDRASRSDDSGLFRFEALEPGEWTVRARWNTLLVADRTVTLADQPVEVELARPPSGEIRGRLLLPEGAEFSQLALRAWPAPGEFVGITWKEEECDVAADGSFHVESLPLGPRRFSLALPPVRAGGGGYHAQADVIGTLEVRAPPTEPIEIDLRETMPGWIEAHARIDGVAALAAWIEIARVSGVSSGIHGSSLDRDGRMTLAGVPPGVVRASLRSADELWCWLAPQPIRVAPGRTTPVEFEVDTFERELHVVDAANGAPLAGFELSLATEGARGEHIATRRTNGSGRVRLGMPQVVVRFASSRDERESIAPSSATWSAGDPLELRVSRSP